MTTPPLLSLAQAVEVSRAAREAADDAPIKTNRRAFRLCEQSYRYHGRIAANLRRKQPRPERCRHSGAKRRDRRRAARRTIRPDADAGAAPDAQGRAKGEQMTRKATPTMTQAQFEALQERIGCLPDTSHPEGYFKLMDIIEEVALTSTPFRLAVAQHEFTCDEYLEWQRQVFEAGTPTIYTVQGQDDKGTDRMAAVTGGGPSSLANAAFFCLARPMILHLIETNREIYRLIEENRAEREANHDRH